jgi:hypothetical protein
MFALDMICEIFNPNANPRFVRLLRIIKYLAVPRSPVSYCKYLLFPLCHGRGREFESRRPRHIFNHLHPLSVRAVAHLLPKPGIYYRCSNISISNISLIKPAMYASGAAHARASTKGDRLFPRRVQPELRSYAILELLQIISMPACPIGARIEV